MKTKHALLIDAVHTVSFELVRDKSANFIVEATLMGGVGKLYSTKKVFDSEVLFEEYWNEDLSKYSIQQVAEGVLDQYYSYCRYQAYRAQSELDAINNLGYVDEDYVCEM